MSMWIELWVDVNIVYNIQSVNMNKIIPTYVSFIILSVQHSYFIKQESFYASGVLPPLKPFREKVANWIFANALPETIYSNCYMSYGPIVLIIFLF